MRSRARSGLPVGAVSGIALFLSLQSPGGAQIPLPPPQCQLAPTGELPTCSQTTARVNQCWEKAIQSTIAYQQVGDAYKDLKVEVTFSGGPGGQTIYKGLAWWDARYQSTEVFRFRTAFPILGTWSWATSCKKLVGTSEQPCPSNLGLNQSGTISVSPLPGTSNSLWSGGFLKQLTRTVPPSIQEVDWITYGNGQPFPWVGDSAWAATMQATPAEWRTYVNDRSNRGFSVIHLALAPHWAWTGAVNTNPFTVPSGCSTPATAAPFTAPFSRSSTLGDAPAVQCPTSVQESANWLPCDASLPQNPFWQRFEQMVQCANNAGLTVFVSGIARPAGLQEASNATYYPTLANAKKFARYIAGRLGGSYAILSPGFDDGGESLSQGRIQEIGSLLKTSAPRHIVSNHFGTHAGSSQPYWNISGSTNDAATIHSQAWLGFQMYQSGFANQNLQKITYRPSALARALRGFTVGQFNTPIRKRAVNGEAVYDQGYNLTAALPSPPGAVSPAPATWRYFSRSRARQAAWASLLSGANGYSLGVMGVWDWGICGNANVSANPIWCNQNLSDSCGETPTPYQNFRDPLVAVGQASSSDMTRLRTIVFNGVDFANLLTTERNCDAGELACINNNLSECLASGSGCGSTEERRMFFARDANTLIAYLPDQPSIQLRLDPSLGFGDTQGRVASVFKRPYLNGTEVALPPASPSAGNLYTFSRPLAAPFTGEINDWVLVIVKPSGAAAPETASALSVTARLSTESSSTGEIVVEYFHGGAGEAPVSSSVLGAATQYEKQSPSLSRSSTGSVLVAWLESAILESGPTATLHARILSSEGAPAPNQVEIALKNGARVNGLATAPTPGGGFVLFWRTTADTGSIAIWAAAVKAQGAVEYPAREVVGSTSGTEIGRVRVACGAHDCAMAWSENEALSGLSRVVAARFDAETLEAGPTWVLSDSENEAFWPVALAEENGEFLSTWERIGEGYSLGVSAATVP